MDDLAAKFAASVPYVQALQYAIETMEIEKSRLVEAIRAMRAMAATEDDYPGTRVKEQRDALESVEQSIAFLHQAVDQSRRNQTWQGAYVHRSD
jgi:membrane glycosyltransferase